MRVLRSRFAVIVLNMAGLAALDGVVTFLGARRWAWNGPLSAFAFGVLLGGPVSAWLLLPGPRGAHFHACAAVVTVLTTLGIAAHPLRPAWWTGAVSVFATLFWFVCGFVALFSGK